jgi:hypothetical protein
VDNIDPMSFSTLLEVLALIAFIVGATGFTYRKTDLIAVGLALWALAVLIPRLSAITLGTVLLLVAFIVFVGAAIGWKYRKLNLIAAGLAVWMLSIVLPAFGVGG